MFTSKKMDELQSKILCLESELRTAKQFHDNLRERVTLQERVIETLGNHLGLVIESRVQPQQFLVTITQKERRHG